MTLEELQKAVEQKLDRLAEDCHDVIISREGIKLSIKSGWAKTLQPTIWKWFEREITPLLVEVFREKVIDDRKQLSEGHAKIQRLCDIWVSHIEPDDHQLAKPYFFSLARLTWGEKTEFATILKELLETSGHHFLTVGEAREKLKESSKSSEEDSPAHRLLRTCCGKQYDKNEVSKETDQHELCGYSNCFRPFYKMRGFTACCEYHYKHPLKWGKDRVTFTGSVFKKKETSRNE